MADVNLTGIKFLIQYDTGDATKEITRLSNALRKLKKAFTESDGKKAKKGMDAVKDGAQKTAQATEEAAKAANGNRFKQWVSNIKGKLTSAYETLGKATSKTKEKMSQFMASIGRIAMYRAIRTALKMVTQALMEGTKNFYLYSKTVDGSFAKSMDNIASSLQTFKNSLGVTAAALIQLFEPAITAAADALTEFNNRLSEFNAYHAGEETFIRATKAVKEYAKATRDLLGIDVLNKVGDKDKQWLNYEIADVSISGNSVKTGNAFQSLLLSNDTVGAITMCGTTLAEVFAGAWIGRLFGPAGMLTGAMLGGVIGITTSITGYMTGIWSTVEGSINGFVGNITKTWNDFVGKLGLDKIKLGDSWTRFWDSILGNLRFVFVGTFKLLTGDFSGFWQELKLAATSAIDWIGSLFIGRINNIIDGINLVIGFVNQFISFGGLLDIAIPEIPKIDASKVPSLSDAVRGEMGILPQSNSASGALNGTGTVNLYIDGQKVGSSVTRNQGMTSRMTARSLAE